MSDATATESVVTLTENAAAQIKAIQEREAENAGKPLRLFIEGGGCSGTPALAGGVRQDTVASFADQERAYEHLREALTAVGFLFGSRADALMHAVRQLVGRAMPSPQEVKILHGLARQLLYVAGKRKHPGAPGGETPGPGERPAEGP